MVWEEKSSHETFQSARLVPENLRTYLSGFISCDLQLCIQHTELAACSSPHPKLSHLCEAAHPELSSCQAPSLPHSHGNPSHPSRPSSSVISSVKALLICPTGCESFLLSMSIDSTFFVPLSPGALLLYSHLFPPSCELATSPYMRFFFFIHEILRFLEAKTILLTYLHHPAEKVTFKMHSFQNTAWQTKQSRLRRSPIKLSKKPTKLQKKKKKKTTS